MSRTSAEALPTLAGFCTLKEIAAYYQVDRKTMKKKIEDIGLLIVSDGTPKRKYSPAEITAIRKVYG
jgi:hypothetical protein